MVEYPDVLAVDSGHDQPETAGFNHQGQEESQGSVLLELAQDRRRSLLAPSPVSDDGTLVAFDEEATQCKPLSVSPPATPVTREPELEADEDAVPAPATLRFQIGLELLTRELSSALGHRAAGDGNDASGLQIWVMIEAYERLRDQIAGTGPGNEEAREAIDSWLEALHAIHRTMAGEAAMSDSEYED
ncbi:hypothetical protein CDD83_6892 [Cordyceps sp. RAO-2017]|nr:hypothetical protein CDD83_6892 [Cordyceps sp. RAO-2017]